mmetsp:Transcript_15654/g.49152  ORF Transcript_15654/g.49152 Transcript_15654/m.49152 type:complete len:357 (-) Transcript_15654:897-1967(-)
MHLEKAAAKGGLVALRRRPRDLPCRRHPRRPLLRRDQVPSEPDERDARPWRQHLHLPQPVGEPPPLVLLTPPRVLSPPGRGERKVKSHEEQSAPSLAPHLGISCNVPRARRPVGGGPGKIPHPQGQWGRHPNLGREDVSPGSGLEAVDDGWAAFGERAGEGGLADVGAAQDHPPRGGHPVKPPVLGFAQGLDHRVRPLLHHFGRNKGLRGAIALQVQPKHALVGCDGLVEREHCEVIEREARGIQRGDALGGPQVVRNNVRPRAPTLALGEVESEGEAVRLKGLEVQGAEVLHPGRTPGQDLAGQVPRRRPVDAIVAAEVERRQPHARAPLPIRRGLEDSRERARAQVADAIARKV